MSSLTPQPPAAQAVSDAIVDVGCQLASILRHMEAFRAAGASAPDAPEPVEVLRALLAETLAPVLAETGDDDLRDAARIVTTVAATVEREILLVPAPAAARPHRARHRRRRP